MKFSDVKGKRTFDVIADLIEPISSIAQDNEATELFRKRDLPEGMTAEQFVVERIKKAVPALLRNHQDDLIAILSSIGNITPKEYESRMNLMSVTNDVFELFTDREFLAFLSSLMGQEESGSTLGNTEDQTD